MKFRLSPIQLFVMLFLTTGSVFISFQSDLVNATGHDAWWLFLLAGLFHLPHLIVFEKCRDRFIWTRPVCLLYGLYWIYVIVSLIGYTVYTMEVWAFPKTPEMIVVLAIILISLYANINRAETVVNIGVILIPLMAILILFVMMGARDFVWTNLFPVGGASARELYKGWLFSQLPFIGIEVYLLLRKLMPGQIRTKMIVIYSAIWYGFYSFMLIVPFLYFSIKEFSLIGDPIIYLLKAQQVTFLERLDLIFIYIWLIWSITTIMVYVFAVLRLMIMCGARQMKRKIIWFHVGIAVLAMFFTSKEMVHSTAIFYPYAHLLFAILLPAFIMVFNKLRGKRDGGGGAPV